MHYILTLLLTLLLSGIVQGQSFSVEAAAGPTMAYRITTAEESFKKAVDEDQPMLSYEAGVRMLYSLNENWRVGGGLMYSRKGFHIEPYQFANEFGEPMKDVESKYVFSFLELPLVARYVIKEKNKFRLYTQSGLGASFLLQERVLLEEPMNFNGKPIQEIYLSNVLRSVNLTFHAGVGASYRLADGWQVGAEPAFNSHLLPMLPSGENNVAIQRRLFSLGLNLVASYSW